MRSSSGGRWMAIMAALCSGLLAGGSLAQGTAALRVDPRMDWWREARFGMFIHWGLYAVPAGEWNGETGHGEWIMNTAHIPVEEYEKLKAQFNPAKFDADAIVRAAKNAGMKYIVITSKHHDGFNLFDSKETDWDVMSTPFKRDIMKEMAVACRKQGMKICWYHSIMDWHHPDYTPRRDWEKRSADGADMDRYVKYLKAELKELLTNYGPIGILWFDGQWEGTWNDERGKDLYAYVRSLQKDIIINNRVGKAGGDWGLNKDQGQIGDYGTPEQEIPATGIPGADWETCMTMNDHWGYNRADKHFKTTEDLIHKLADIASKGGNFLLNVGPTGDGEIPPESVDRLEEIGKWMKVNGDAIHGTQASPFPKLTWGRCTQRDLKNGKTRLYLHVFEWPKEGKLVLGGILNDPAGAYLMADPSKKRIAATRQDDALVLMLPQSAPDAIDSVVVLDVTGKPDITEPPKFAADAPVFVSSLDVAITTDRDRVELRYTADGSEPGPTSTVVAGPVKVTKTTTLRARAFRGSAAVSPVTEATYTRVAPRAAQVVDGAVPGLASEYFEKHIAKCAELDGVSPTAAGPASGFDISTHKVPTEFAYRFKGFLRVPQDGVYHLFTKSDDGSQLWVGDQLVVDNDKPHSLHEESGVVALAAGLHPITVTFFENSGGFDLKVLWSGPGIQKADVPGSALFRKP